MRLDLQDTLALLDRLLAAQPPTTKPGNFTVQLRRLRDLLMEKESAEPRFSDLTNGLFPGVLKSSLRATFLKFRKALVDAADTAQFQIHLIRPDARGKAAGEVHCHFEGVPLPLAFDAGYEEMHLSRENEIIEPRARATKIFVSFAMKDQKLSKEFTEQLKVNLPLRFSEPVNLWRFDEQGGILPGEDNEAIIRQKMSESQFGILLLSPTYLQRPFIKNVELPHFIGPAAKAHPIPVALEDFTPGADKHPLLAPTNVFTFKGKNFCQTPKKERGDFIKALCDLIATLITKHSGNPPASSAPPSHPSIADFSRFSPEPRDEDGNYIEGFAKLERLAKAASPSSEESSEGSIPVLKTLEDWVADPEDSAYMAVLGEAGAGKTMTCSKLAHSLNARHPSSCIYIDLRYLNESGLLKHQPNPTVEEILAAVLSRNAHHEKITPAQVLQAVREKAALLIWDGLDEVLVHLSAQEGDAFFAQLKEALPPRLIQNPRGKPGRLLIACRTHYFRSFEHEASALTQSQRGAVNATAPENQRSRFRVLRLLPFDDDQIRAYLTANVPGLDVARAFEVICQVHNLHDLAQRPYCLSLLRASLPELDHTLAAGKKVRSVDLYRSLVRSWLARDGTKHRFDEDDKPRLMACLAAWMWREGVKSLTAERLGQWLKETVTTDPTFRALYGDSFKETKQRDELLQDFRTATFIARWDGDSFRFAHTSLQEYFLASHLVRALEQGHAGEWLLPQVNRETLDFAAELFVQRAEESPAARGRLEKTITLLMQENQPRRSENALAFFLRLHATGESDFSVSGADLRELDLLAWEFTGTVSRPLRLPAVDFSGAKLIRARFRQVEMADSKWLGADLCSAEFVGCGLERADFSGTRLEGGRSRCCRLNDSRLSDSISDGLRVDLPLWETETAALWRAAANHLLPARPMAGALNACWSLGHRDDARSVAISPDGKRIVSSSNDDPLRIWDAATGECLRVLNGHESWVMSVAISPDGTRIVSGSDDKSLRIWDAATGECLRVLNGHEDLVWSVAISPDGTRIVSGSGDKSLRIWDAATGECLRVLNGHENWVRSVAISPDGTCIVSGSWDKSLRIWDTVTGECLRVLSGHENWVMSVAISPDGMRIVSGSNDKTLRIWDAATGDCLRVLNGHENRVWSLAISPDGTRIVSGLEDKSLRIWDTATGECLRVLNGHENSVMSVAVSPDGTRIVSGSWDKSLRIWDAATGDCLRVLNGHKNPVTRVAISPDGTRLVSGLRDKSVRVWDAETGQSLDLTEADQKLLEEKDEESPSDTLHHITPSGKELDIAALPDGGYVVLEKATATAPWRIARAKGDYWHYVNYATDGPEGRTLWSADALGPVPEV